MNQDETLLVDLSLDAELIWDALQDKLPLEVAKELLENAKSEWTI